MSKRLDQTWIDRIAAAIAEADSADYWVPEITDWETSEEWKREAYPDEYPSSAYEDRERYRKQAMAALLALEPEAREEAKCFRDQDGDLWKFTDKGEWFHEEEPGEFRQVLSIDAEDQTLTPVGRAELAPDAEAREETVGVARVVHALAMDCVDE